MLRIVQLTPKSPLSHDKRHRILGSIYVTDHDRCMHTHELANPVHRVGVHTPAISLLKIKPTDRHQRSREDKVVVTTHQLDTLIHVVTVKGNH